MKVAVQVDLQMFSSRLNIKHINMFDLNISEENKYI